MFQFTGFPPHGYGFAIRYHGSSVVGCPIQISADRCVFATPRSFSQLITSFIGSQCQGIHPAPYTALPSYSSFGSRISSLACNEMFLSMSCHLSSDTSRYQRYLISFFPYAVFKVQVLLINSFSQGSSALTLRVRQNSFID